MYDIVIFLLVDGARMMRCLHCAFHIPCHIYSLWNVSYIALHFAATSFVCRMVRTLRVPYEAVVQSLPQMFMCDAHRRRFLLCSFHIRRRMMISLCVVFIRCFAVERCVHIIFGISFICALPTLSVLVVLILHCVVAAKLSSKSDSVELSIESVAFYYVAALCFSNCVFSVFVYVNRWNQFKFNSCLFLFKRKNINQK